MNGSEERGRGERGEGEREARSKERGKLRIRHAKTRRPEEGRESRRGDDERRGGDFPFGRISQSVE